MFKDTCSFIHKPLPMKTIFLTTIVHYYKLKQQFQKPITEFTSWRWLGLNMQSGIINYFTVEKSGTLCIIERIWNYQNRITSETRKDTFYFTLKVFRFSTKKKYWNFKILRNLKFHEVILVLLNFWHKLITAEMKKKFPGHIFQETFW